MKQHNIIIFLLVGLVMSGCEGYLDRNPPGQISAPTFWQSKQDFQLALAAIYGIETTPFPWDNPPGGTWASALSVWDNLTDNSYGQHNSGGFIGIAQGNLTPTTGGYVQQAYSLSYQAIARQNVFLQQLTKYTGTDLPAAEKNVMEGEVRFLRAYYYFQLYSLYGDVPLVVEPLTLANHVQPKASSAQVLGQVLTDLNFAIDNLPDGRYDGHVKKSAAQTLKARVLIFDAYDENGTPDVAKLTQVRDLCLAVMPVYQLSQIWEAIFQEGEQTDNPEIIYSVRHLAPNNVPSVGVDLLNGDWLTVSPLKNFVDAFELIDGLPWGVSPLTDPDNPFENRDPRLLKTVFEGYVDWGNGNEHYPTNNVPTGYGVKKFLDPDHTPYVWGVYSPQDAVILRLSEVYLMYAEAQNEIAGPDASVYQRMTDLRARVDMPAYPAGLSQSEMRERIRHERRIELAFEGLRYFDLKRWRIAGEVLPNVTDGIVTYKWENRFYRWPLPQPEVDRSNGVLEQNADYL